LASIGSPFKGPATPRLLPPIRRRMLAPTGIPAG
jgi:hypothetical protein